MTSIALPDHEARLRAATDFAQNLVVVAGAGTGKTSLLIERLLTVIGSGHAAIDDVAAVTFTEKAAGEMRQRFAEGLDRLRALGRSEREPDTGDPADRALEHLVRRFEVGPEQIASRALAALERLDRARVGTIHGFCANLLREFPIEAGVDPDFDVDAGELYLTLREERWEAYLARELGPRAHRADLWHRVLASHDLGDVREVAFRLADFDIPPELIRRESVVSTDLGLLRDIVRQWCRAAERVLDGNPAANRRAGVRFGEALATFRALAEGDVGDFLEANERYNDPASSVGGSEVKPLGPRAQELARDFRNLSRVLVTVDDEAVAELIEAAAPYAREVREELSRRGRITFDGLLITVRDLLRDDPRVRERLKRRFRMLLLDEFQDTDPVQYEIMFLLAERAGSSADDAYRAELEPGRLFIVGDPKQSIYRFRGADYSAFRRAVSHVTNQGGEELRLTANFRSVPGVVAPVNSLFAPVEHGSWCESDYQPPYVPIEAVRDAGDHPEAVELWTIDIGQGALAKERREAEGKIVAAAIREMVARGETRFGRITVLLRTFTHLSDYLRPLRELDLPFIVDGGKEFLKRPEVAHLLVVLKALARPADPVAYLAFLRSPVAAVPDPELARYAAAHGRWSPGAEIDGERFPNIARARDLLRELERVARRSSPGEVVRAVEERTGLLTLSSAAFEGPQRVANLRKLAAAATELAWEGRLSLGEVADALEQGRTAQAEADSPLADEEMNAVRVMTIHKAKGLENDVIFVPDLARQDWSGFPQRVAVDVLSVDGERHLAVKTERSANVARVRHELEEAHHDVAEEVRVLYVGLTRAREKLVLLAAPSRGRASWVEALGIWGYDPKRSAEEDVPVDEGRVRHVRRNADGWRGSEPAGAAPAGAPEAVERFLRGQEILARTAGPPLRAPSDEEAWEPVADRGEGSAVRYRPGGERARAVGIVVHRLLEAWDDGEPEALRALIGPVSREVGTEPDWTEVERESRALIDLFLGSELAPRFGRIDRVGRELPMLLAGDGGAAWGGTIDLLYRDENGGWVVADFKTDQESDPVELRRRYGPQLRIYADAVRAALALDRPPRMELWLVRHGTVVIVDEAAPVEAPGKWEQGRLF